MIDEIPQAQVKNKRFSISAVWIIPVVAALVGGWLVFKSAIEEKILVEVTFESADGLEAGKTVIKLRNVKVGEVVDVRFSDDLSKVIVVMVFTGISKERITDTARFWVVRPRIGIGGISGLDTLLSGAYIEIDPGRAGRIADKFTGDEEPQNYQLGNPGTTFVLSADRLGSLSRGSVVQYKGIDVGKVTRYSLVDDHSHVEIDVFIRAPHDEYVRENTRFWNTSGFEVELGVKGLKFDTESLASIIAGGITFSNNERLDKAQRAPERAGFQLHKTEHPDVKEVLTYGAQMKLYFDDGVSGLSAGAPVEYKGLRLGTVTEVSVESNKDKTDILTYAMVDIEPERLPTGDFNLNLAKEE
ncbi:Paraquat-inducible protein B, partial [hydrothermal vent metagenome]